MSCRHGGDHGDMIADDEDYHDRDGQHDDHNNRKNNHRYKEPGAMMVVVSPMHVLLPGPAPICYLVMISMMRIIIGVMIIFIITTTAT
jgi:hypothetical protein